MGYLDLLPALIEILRVPFLVEADVFGIESKLPIAIEASGLAERALRLPRSETAGSLLSDALRKKADENESRKSTELITVGTTRLFQSYFSFAREMEN